MRFIFAVLNYFHSAFRSPSEESAEEPAVITFQQAAKLVSDYNSEFCATFELCESKRGILLLEDEKILKVFSGDINREILQRYLEKFSPAHTIVNRFIH